MSGLRRALLALAPVVLVALVGSACATDVENPAVAEGTSPIDASATTTSSVPPGGRQPSASDRLRVVLAGDSVMNGLAPAVATALNLSLIHI